MGGAAITSGSGPRVPGLAIAALVLGLASFAVPVLGLIAAVLALVFGVKAKNRIDASRGGLTGSGLAIAGIVCGAVGLAVGLFALVLVAAISIPSYLSFSGGARESRLASNMSAARVAAEEFAALTGHYPATINTTVKQVLGDLGQESDDERSIADAGGEDPAAQKDLNSSGNSLLASTLENPWERSLSGLVIATGSGRPVWSEKARGMVWYVPSGVEGNHASGFEIYGVGRSDLRHEVLSSD